VGKGARRVEKGARTPYREEEIETKRQILEELERLRGKRKEPKQKDEKRVSFLCSQKERRASRVLSRCGEG